MNEKEEVEYIENDELSTYSYISNGFCFEYFVGYEIASLLGYKNTTQIVNSVSKSNQLIFREFPGLKEPELDPRTILITRDGVIEILLKTRKRLTSDVLHILKKFQIETTNKKCLTKEQQTLSAIANAFKTEKIEDQLPVGSYFLDMYFTEYKLVIECDENGHVDRKPCDERERMNFVNGQLNIDDSNWIRYNPDEYDFDISKVIGKIYKKIEECKKLKIEDEKENYFEDEKQKLLRSIKAKEEELIIQKNKLSEVLSKKINQYSLDGKYIKTYNSITEAHLDTSILMPNIVAACRASTNGNYEKSAGNYMWRYYENTTEDIEPIFYAHKKKVAQYSLEGKLIKVFNSVVDAANDIKKFRNRSEIARVCNEEGHSAHGFMWKYIKDNIVEENIPKYSLHNNKNKKIHMYKDDVLIDSFYTISEAAKKTKRSRTAITKYISGKGVNCSGYIWKKD